MLVTMTATAGQRLIAKGDGDSGAPVLWVVSRNVPGFIAQPLGSLDLSMLAVETATTAVAVEVHRDASARVSRCSFELGGPGVVLTGGSAIIDHVEFGTVCKFCDAISIRGANAEADVLITGWAGSGRLSDAVDFDVCVLAVSGQPAFRNRNCPATTALALTEDTGPWGQVHVEGELGLTAAAGSRPLVDALFFLAEGSSLTANGLDFKQSVMGLRRQRGQGCF
jgi:hypothetical protein